MAVDTCLSSLYSLLACGPTNRKQFIWNPKNVLHNIDKIFKIKTLVLINDCVAIVCAVLPIVINLFEYSSFRRKTSIEFNHLKVH